jgi:putative transposase
MNPPRVQPEDYIDFLIATPKACRATEAARVQPDPLRPPAHDAFTRLLHRLEPDAQTLWQEALTQVALTDGVLVADDSTLDKPYAKAIELVGRHWSGKHHAVVQGINLVSLLWTRPMATVTSPAITASTTTPRRPPRTTISAPCSRRLANAASSRVA